MAGKRKRHRPKVEVDEASHRFKPSQSSNTPSNVVRQSLLSQFYPTVLTLREYLLLKLPKDSKIRRKKVTAAGRDVKQLSGGIEGTSDGGDALLASYLDTTLVGIRHDSLQNDQRATKWNTFSSRTDESELTVGDISFDSRHSQSEVGLLG